MEKAIEVIEKMIERKGDIAFGLNMLMAKEVNKKIKKVLEKEERKYANDIDVLEEVINELKKADHEA